jgi:DNA-binding NarL/FixJ family response regulator
MAASSLLPASGGVSTWSVGHVARAGRGVVGVSERRGVSSPVHLRLLTGSADDEPAKVIPLDHRARSRGRDETLIRVLIAAGDALARASYRALLDPDERIEVVGEASSSKQALALAAATAPDVALLHLGLPGLDELQATAAIVSHPAFAGVAVMLIALGESDERVFSALRAGASGVLSNDAEPAELIRALEVLARGHALLPAGAIRRMLAELPPQSDHTRLPVELEELTDREREVVALVGMGLSNDEIGARLGISPATAKTHVSRAMVKLQARDRAQLVVIAYEARLVLARPHAARDGDPSNASV